MYCNDSYTKNIINKDVNVDMNKVHLCKMPIANDVRKLVKL